MFILANSDGRFIMLRCCECGETQFIEKQYFSAVTSDHVILKDNARLTCKNCNSVHTDSESYICLEPQITNASSQTAPESDLPFWMTRDITTEELMRTVIFD